MTTTIRGWRNRDRACREARRISTDPRVIELVDGAWLAVGAESLYGPVLLYGRDHCTAERSVCLGVRDEADRYADEHRSRLG